MTMRTIVSQSSHSILKSAGAIRGVNATLQQACDAMFPFELRGLAFSWRMVHLGQGHYRRGDGAAPHVHEQLHLESIMDGTFRFEHESGAMNLSPGEALLVLPQERHSWECAQPGLMLGALISILGPAQHEFINVLRGQCEGMVVVNPLGCATWQRELLRILTDPGSAAVRLPIVTGLLRLLLIEMLNAATDLSSWQGADAAETAVGDERSRDLCRHALEFIEANYGQPIQVRDVALQVGISPRHLNRLYRRIHGESIGSALQRVRLARARQHLRQHPEDLIKAVAFSCGFNSTAYFAASYRKAFGHVPGEDRHVRGQGSDPE